MSWTEIAVDMAKLIAHQHGCELESFSLDAVEVDDENGVEVIHIQATAQIVELPDEIPYDDEIPFELPGIAEHAQ